MDHGRSRKGVRSRWDFAAGMRESRRSTVGSGINCDGFIASPQNQSRNLARSGQYFDVFCSGMYRACSTWQYEVVSHIVEHHGGGHRLGYVNGAQYADLLSNPARAPQDRSGISWRVLKSHEGDRSFSRALAGGRALAVYVFRDVRDVVFSLMHKRGLTFEQLLRQGMIHQVLENDRFWMRQPGLLVQRYEDILADPIACVRQLADHLGFDLDEGDAELIASEYSLESNKARTDVLRKQLEKVGVDLNGAENAQICDSTTLLHWNHVRSGRAGSWDDEATPLERWILLRLCGRWLSLHGYPQVPTQSKTKPLLALRARDRLRIEANLIAGWTNQRIRSASQRYPKLALRVKRLLGMQIPPQLGATVFSESKPEPSMESTTRES